MHVIIGIMYVYRLIPPPEHSLLFETLLTQGLHLQEGIPGVRSRMENVATGARPVNDGLTVIGAFNMLSDNPNIPIGLAFCEHPAPGLVSHNAFILKDAFRSNSSVKHHCPWKLLHAGFFSVYVNPDYRNQGVASSLLHHMEKQRRDAIAQTYDDKHSNDALFFTARQGSVPLINNHAKLGAACEVAVDSSNFKAWTHHFSHARTMALEYGHTLDIPEHAQRISWVNTPVFAP